MTRTILPGLRTGVIRIPASKSQAHRMLICAALSASPSHLILDGFSADIEATMQCLEALGARCEKISDGLLVSPVSVCPAQARLDVGESGSTLRFLLPVLGALGIRAEIQMHGRLPARPLSPLWEALEMHAPMASPMRGSCRRRRLMRWTAPRKRTASTSSVTASPCHLPLVGEGFGMLYRQFSRAFFPGCSYTKQDRKKEEAYGQKILWVYGSRGSG